MMIREMYNKVLLALLLAALLPLALPGSPAAAQTSNTFTVNSTADKVDIDPGDGFCDADIGSAATCTLRAAIMEANDLGGAQTIVLPTGTYALTIPGINDNAGRSGDLDITSDISIVGTARARPTIDAKGLDRVFQVFGNVSSVRLQNLIIRGGATSEDSGEADLPNGGGVFVINGRVTIRNSLITNNRADFGGGIAGNRIGAITIEASTVQNNQALGGGGGVGSNGRVTILASSINNNTAGAGGGISR